MKLINFLSADYFKLKTKEKIFPKMELLYYISLAWLVAVKVSAECLDGFEHHGNGCYKVAALEASWMEAKMYCRLLGSELAIIDDATEEATIEGILSKFHNSHIDENYWLAGTDIINENSWRWMTNDGSSIPITYTNWLHGRPDNVGGNENCLILSYPNKATPFWNDVRCDGLHSFICETGYDVRTEVIG